MATNPPVLLLASASPTRKKLLENAGFRPRVQVSYFDESLVTVQDPAAHVTTLAQCKAEVVARDLPMELRQVPTLVLGCDSILFINGQVRGKPDSPTVAIATWEQMRGKSGDLYTGHCLLDVQKQRMIVRHRVTTVYFVAATDEEVHSYVATGEPVCCSGCFTLEGLGGSLIERLDGCHTNVLGLSLPLLREMLRELGYRLLFTAAETLILPIVP
ncbi:MAG: septum formation inhibitor Maf [Oscillatoriales cyanobacterium SM2_2_1]|nr:septum formation inhibitor Maf [Oscillatoriales cyanobacterium SM2_2_1]